MSVYPPDLIGLGQLVLRRERLGDADLVARTVTENLGHLSPWMPWAVPAAATPAAQRERLVGVEQSWEDGSDHTFLLLDSPESILFGIFGLHRRIGPAAIELGYWLSGDAVGKGHATVAAGARCKCRVGVLSRRHLGHELQGVHWLSTTRSRMPSVARKVVAWMTGKKPLFFQSSLTPLQSQYDVTSVVPSSPGSSRYPYT